MGIAGYFVRYNQTGQRMRCYSGTDAGRRAARRYADRKDMEYGAIRYIVVPIYVESV